MKPELRNYFFRKISYKVCHKIFGNNFCGSFGKTRREIPSNSRYLDVLRTRKKSLNLNQWKLHGVWHWSGSKLLNWFETDVSGFQTEVCKRSWFRNLQYHRSKTGVQRRGKNGKRGAKRAKKEMAPKEEQEAPYPPNTHVNNIFYSVFSNVEVYSNNQQNYVSDGLYAKVVFFRTISRGSSLNTKVFCNAVVLLWRTSRGIHESAFVWTFFTRILKILSKPVGFILYNKLGVDFVSTSELLCPNLKTMIRLIRARPIFLTWLVATRKLVLELFIVHLTLVVLFSKANITKNDWTGLRLIPWSSTSWSF